MFSNLIKITKRLLGVTTKGIVMAKEDVVNAGVAAVQAAEVSALSSELGKAYDAGLAEAPVSGPAGPSEEEIQARIDAAVLAKADNDAQALDAFKAASDEAKAAIQKELDDLKLKEGAEAGVIANLQGSLQKLKDAEALLQALFPVVSDPAPVEPDPQP